MKQKEIAPYQQNQALKKQFQELGLARRPWCDAGQSLGWTEDNEAGGMHLRAELRDFVSMNPQSKEVLDAFNRALDEEMKGFGSADPKYN